MENELERALETIQSLKRRLDDLEEENIHLCTKLFRMRFMLNFDEEMEILRKKREFSLNEIKVRYERQNGVMSTNDEATGRDEGYDEVDG